MKTLVTFVALFLFSGMSANAAYMTDQPFLQSASDVKLLVKKKLIQNFGLSEQSAAGIIKDNELKFFKMHQLDLLLAKYKAVTINESLSRNPDQAKLDKLYSQMKRIKNQKINTWVGIKKSIWDHLGINEAVKKRAVDMQERQDESIFRDISLERQIDRQSFN